ncbi:MAG: Trp family transcriptional regulator [Minisyncoccota bacterium]
MPRAIKNKVPLDIQNKVLDELLLEFRKVNSIENLNIFFKKFMTYGEKDTIIRRLAIIKYLNNGKKYREIKKTLCISNSTISNSRDIMAGRGYGQNPNRKKVYSRSLIKSKPKFKKRLRYKGAGNIIEILDPLFDQ